MAVNINAAKIWGYFIDVFFGNSSHHSKFEADGTLVMVGDATVYDDVSGDALSLLQTGVGISSNATEGTVDYLVSSNLSDYIYTNVQNKHGWESGSVVFPHIHFFQTTAVIPNFLLQYRWQRNGQAKTTAWTNLICRTPVFTYASGTLDQIATTVAGITPPANYSISDIIQFRVIRDNANTSGAFTGVDGVNATVGVLSFDVHIRIDTIGSRTQTTK
jgi:hypothetical protein